MTVKSFKAKSIQSAIGLIKEELGPDAMILSTRRLPKNIRDPYSDVQFEVTASLQGGAADGEPPRPSLGRVERRTDVTEEADDSFRADDLLSGLGCGGEDICLTGEKADFEAIQAELVSIKDMLWVMNSSDSGNELMNMPVESFKLYTRFAKTGISERLTGKFLKKAAGSRDGRNPSANEVTRRVFNDIFSFISVSSPFEENDRKQHIAAFVGPTGVGKTTTVAKLAADLSLKKKKKVGLISIDGYRIGALEQLKTYANIMGIPCLPAFSRKELENALRKMESRDVILIDTAGHSHLDDQRMKELAGFMKGGPHISTHLVLSATTGRMDMADAAANFKMLNPESYVFTKLDETRRRGVILDQIFDHSLPVSFITNGQNVPDDIIGADPKKILQMIFEISK